MGDRSAHFSDHEFMDVRTGHQLRPPDSLIAVLEKIRALRGVPLLIVSGHRCRSTNTAVGGAARSRHLAGDAADFRRGHATTAEAHACGAVGVGSADGWAIHVDVRPGRQADWRY